MYSVIVWLIVEDKIKFFIDWYKSSFLDRFSNTGLYYEDIIRENYTNTSRRFHEEILDKIEIFFSDKQILWNFPISPEKSSIYLVVQNFKLKILYTEDECKKMREIYDIEFHKK